MLLVQSLLYIWPFLVYFTFGSNNWSNLCGCGSSQNGCYWKDVIEEIPGEVEDIEIPKALTGTYI